MKNTRFLEDRKQMTQNTEAEIRVPAEKKLQEAGQLCPEESLKGQRLEEPGTYEGDP